jgi:hypothetical protein
VSIIGSMGILGIGSVSTGAYQDVLYAVAVAFLIAGIIACIGGFAAMFQQSWYAGIVGGIAGIFSFGAFWTVMSIIGLIIVIISKKEFYRHVSRLNRRYP